MKSTKSILGEHLFTVAIPWKKMSHPHLTAINTPVDALYPSLPSCIICLNISEDGRRPTNSSQDRMLTGQSCGIWCWQSQLLWGWGREQCPGPNAPFHLPAPSASSIPVLCDILWAWERVKQVTLRLNTYCPLWRVDLLRNNLFSFGSCL